MNKSTADSGGGQTVPDSKTSNTPQETPLEKYLFEVMFTAAHEPIDLRIMRGTVECASILHVQKAIETRVREKFPRATEFEVQSVSRITDSWMIERVAYHLKQNERWALLGALKHNKCDRSASCHPDGSYTHYHVGDKLRKAGLFNRVFTGADGKKSAYVLSELGLKVAKVLDAQRGGSEAAK